MQTSIRPFQILLYFILGTIKIHAQDNKIKEAGSPEFLAVSTPWVDSVFNTLSKKEKIGQLFMVPAYSNRDEKSYEELAKLIEKEQIGGIVFFQGGPVEQSRLLNRYQSLLKVPALVAMDAEWGVGMRLDSTVSYPYQMTLGAISNNELIYNMGQQIAKDFKRLGMHVNFAPVVDVNNNINNPVINYRSFGEDMYKVADKGFAYMRGLQDGGIMATVKHFPGHGDTDVDSHLGLPTLNFSRERLDSLELYPFRYLINRGISGVMVAHMNIPALDKTPNLPSTLSRPIITGVLREELNFQGLVFTDAMNMKGVTRNFPTGEVELMAVAAGNDLIELSEDVELAISSIRKAIRRGVITWEEIDARVKRILAAKEWAGLDNYQPVDTDQLFAALNRREADVLIQRLADESLTLLRDNPPSYFPIPEPLLTTAVISIGSDFGTVFQRKLAAGKKVSSFVLQKSAGEGEIARLEAKLTQFDRVIVGIHDKRSRPRSLLDFSDPVLHFITRLSSLPKTSFALMANAYTLNQLKGIENARVLVVAYENSPFTEKAAAAYFLKELRPRGKLPVTVNEHFKAGAGLMIFQ
ncbi:beta-glucosidase-like glycosyl hydrolase [Anseongella ginsenosidimutans]|uniref:beta-N-acetylhexosaminidase n=1 Tax=Anseongella ginsenosidimutans TaxID=496056 RepID=A0A4R3KMU1_9SPHI|nr:glycoside hydrolase family 3 N-terminal domain-containing protein [Anseongella ginsenosidimutans]QEC52025.1 glycoside hydrolase family 3 [Anseongella ginsenosidimutans]TCS85670.1 beta-glucosidase-like glycosyl hydrolase [Anseongella ginsenosidimutans]